MLINIKLFTGLHYKNCIKLIDNYSTVTIKKKQSMVNFDDVMLNDLLPD